VKSVCLTLILAIAQPLFSQSNQRPPTPPEVQAEQLRIQAEERTRREAERRDWVTKIFNIKNVQPQVLRQALSMFRAEIVDTPQLRVLSVRAPKEIMPAIEEAIAMLDVPRPPAPSKTAELTVYVLLATEQADSTAQMPQVLRPVVDQLKNVMTYKGYKLVDTIITKGGNGRIATSGGVLPPLYRNAGRPSEYSFTSVLTVLTLEGKPNVLQVSQMEFKLQVDIANAAVNPAMPATPFGPPHIANPTIRTDVEIPSGQQVVVGKATLGDNALILVMSAKFLD
jgi:hypothetical protein